MTQLSLTTAFMVGCCGDILPVCFQKDLQFYFIYLGFFVHKSNHSEGNDGSDHSCHFPKVKSALPADGRLSKGGAERGEQETHI